MLISELAATWGLLTSSRSSNGCRTYGPADVKTVRRVKALLNVGLPVATIALLFPCVVDASPCLDPCTAT